MSAHEIDQLMGQFNNLGEMIAESSERDKSFAADCAGGLRTRSFSC
jgi:hypothetical protein